MYKIKIKTQYVPWLRLIILMILSFLVRSHWFVLGILNIAYSKDLKSYLQSYMVPNLMAFLIVHVFIYFLRLIQVTFFYYLSLYILILATLYHVIKSPSAISELLSACLINLMITPVFAQNIWFNYSMRIIHRTNFTLLGVFSAYLVSMIVVSENQQEVINTHVSYLHSQTLDLIAQTLNNLNLIEEHYARALKLEKEATSFLQILFNIQSELSQEEYSQLIMYVNSVEQVAEFIITLHNFLKPSHLQVKMVQYCDTKLLNLRKSIVHNYQNICKVNLLK